MPKFGDDYSSHQQSKQRKSNSPLQKVAVAQHQKEINAGKREYDFSIMNQAEEVAAALK